MAPTHSAAPAIEPSSIQVSLTSYRLSLLMPALCEGSRTTGRLMVERGKVRRRFVFRDGYLISEGSTVPAEHLAQVLANLRILDPERAAEAYAEAERRRQPLGAYLVERGLVDKPRLLEAMQHKAREALFDCYTWSSGDLWFQPRDVVPQKIELRIKPMELHRDALARMREWKAFRDALPDPDATFRVERRHVRFGGTKEEQTLLDAAESGATLEALLGVGGTSSLSVARLILQLYQRGALVPWAQVGSQFERPQLEQELMWIQSQMTRGNYEQAAEGALKLMEHAPEAHELFREAEAHLAKAMAKRVAELEGQVQCEPLPRPAPPELTVDDLYVYLKLKDARSLREALKASAMGEQAATRCLFRLMDAGVVKLIYDFL